MVDVLVPILIVVGAVVGMEGVAWFTHRYVMHGWGWRWHRSHHEPRSGVFEKNDRFAIIFAGIAVVLFAAGDAWSPLWWLAIGVTLYGVLYFLVHDGLVHRRWPFRYTPRNRYLKRLVEAHRLHHAVSGKEGCVSFGFLYAQRPEVLRERLKESRRSVRSTA